MNRSVVRIRGVPETRFWNGASTLKQYSFFPRAGQSTTLSTCSLPFPLLGFGSSAHL